MTQIMTITGWSIDLEKKGGEIDMFLVHGGVTLRLAMTPDQARSLVSALRKLLDD